MITTIDGPASALDVDFSIARSDLADARFRQRLKDTPGNRAAVAAARARMDDVLDMHLAATATDRYRNDPVAGGRR